MQMLHNTPFNRSAQDRRSRFQMGCNGGVWTACCVDTPGRSHTGVSIRHVVTRMLPFFARARPESAVA